MKNFIYILIALLIIAIIIIIATMKVTIVAKGDNRDYVITNKGGLRKTCLECVRKHLAKAQILFTEAKLGYPDHFWLGLGNMSEAEDEVVKGYPELAERIREMRTAIYRGEDVDYMQLFKDVDAVEKAEILNASSTTNTNT